MRGSTEHFFKEKEIHQGMFKGSNQGERKTNFCFCSTNFGIFHKMLTRARTSLLSAENSLHNGSLCSFLLPNVISQRIP